jgi:hypothetical protein
MVCQVYLLPDLHRIPIQTKYWNTKDNYGYKTAGYLELRRVYNKCWSLSMTTVYF